jgi:hypothetical protein
LSHPCNNCRNAFSKLKKEFPDAFPETLKLKCDNGSQNLAERCGVMLTHMRRIANPNDDLRWKQCTNCLQDFETTALERIVMPLKDIIDGSSSIARTHSGVSSETPRKSLARRSSDTSQVSCDSHGIPKCPEIPDTSKHLARHHSGESAFSCDSEGIPKCPHVDFPLLLPKKALAVLKRPAAAIQEPNKANAQAAAPKANGKAKAKAKPKAVAKSMVKPANALKLRPRGCSKCRRRPGCCNSCWLQRG